MKEEEYKKFACYLSMHYGIIELKRYAPTVSFLGFCYFTGIDTRNGNKLFIKWDATKGEGAEREATMLQNLAPYNKNGYFPTLHGYESSGEYPFIALDFIEGCTLKRVLQTIHTNEIDKHCLLQQLIEILTILKQTHIVHRDARPDNFMWNEDTSRLMLIDFAFSMPLLLMNRKELPYLVKHPLLLKELGGRFKPESHVWDDAYAFCLIGKLLDPHCEQLYPVEWSSIQSFLGKTVYST